ncbi:MAG: excinuclease ABC subunit UvrB, partial [Deltaproteobacteria bacterium]|nr:excinuclease ABC subunit UvrB [Deltaproteobacteria bacterium]
SKDAYLQMLVHVHKGQRLDRDELIRQLVEVQYVRNDIDFHRGTFRVRGDVVDVFPACEENRALRIEFWGDEIDRIAEFDPISGKIICNLDRYRIFPASHYVVPANERKRAIDAIREELRERLLELEAQGKWLERQRLEQRTLYDLEMLEQTGFCHGIENYSRHLSGRQPGEPPPVLVDYFPPDFLLVIDESHQTIPQLQGMYRGDRSRKEVLVEHGFRLPSALDNRPLRFDEFWSRIGQAIFVSATPGDWEIEQSKGAIVEQIIRPTGLMDPEVEVRPVERQVEDLLHEIRQRIARKERVLVTTLTKRMAENLTEYFTEMRIKVKYLHSDIDTLERVDILRELRKGEIDVIVGINLLREGLDLPEVSLVAILDADKEGFLRSPRALIQIIGRAARNVNGKVIMYADRITPAMKIAIEETNRRRAIQEEYNRRHGIIPKTVKGVSFELDVLEELNETKIKEKSKESIDALSKEEIEKRIEELRKEMLEAAEALEFEKAAELRDRIRALRARLAQDPGSA